MIEPAMSENAAAAVAQMPRRSAMAKLWQRLALFRRPEDREPPDVATANMLYGTPDRMPGDSAPCLLCGRPLRGAGGLVEVEGGPDGYFWRSHFRCLADAHAEDLAIVDMMLIAMILRNGD